jgi:hypothetical protein
MRVTFCGGAGTGIEERFSIPCEVAEHAQTLALG